MNSLNPFKYPDYLILGEQWETERIKTIGRIESYEKAANEMYYRKGFPVWTIEIKTGIYPGKEVKGFVNALKDDPLLKGYIGEYGEAEFIIKNPPFHYSLITIYPYPLSVDFIHNWHSKIIKVCSRFKCWFKFEVKW